MYLHECDIPCLKARHLFAYLFIFFSLFNFSDANSKWISSFRSKTPINNVLIRGDKVTLLFKLLVYFIDVDVDLQVYVAAVNSLYLLNGTDLGILEQTISGPVLDSPECSPTLENCIGSRDSIQQTDNYNKILQYLPNEKLLLVCGSVRQGIIIFRHKKWYHRNKQSFNNTSKYQQRDS